MSKQTDWSAHCDSCVTNGEVARQSHGQTSRMSKQSDWSAPCDLCVTNGEVADLGYIPRFLGGGGVVCMYSNNDQDNNNDVDDAHPTLRAGTRTPTGERLGGGAGGVSHNPRHFGY